MENDTFVISSRVKRISIIDEVSGKERGVISFNPTDTLFVERFYLLIGEFETKIKELQNRSDELEKDTRLDANGISINAGDRITLIKEICIYVREKIDHLFGEGTSQIAFGDTLDPDLFSQFFEGVSPFILKARENAMKKYTGKGSSRVMK